MDVHHGNKLVAIIGRNLMYATIISCLATNSIQTDIFAITWFLCTIFLKVYYKVRNLKQTPKSFEKWVYVILCYYFGWELCWHNHFTMLNKIIMPLECLVSNPLRKQMFHQDCIDLRSLIIQMKKNYIKTWKISHKHKW